MLGPAAYSATLVASQLCAAFLYDMIGAFGFDPVTPSLSRVAGVLLAAISAVAYQIAPVTMTAKANQPML